jgi:hypothetical protein
LEDVPGLGRREIVLLYGALRRSGVMLRIPYLVLRAWWRCPFEPDTPANGARLVSSTLGGAFKPILWMLSVVIAGMVGSDFGTSHSSFTSAEQLAIWSFVGQGVIVLTLAYHWWKFLERLRRALVAWVVECNTMAEPDRTAADIALLGYALGTRFRNRFNAHGVKFLAALTFSSVVCMVLQLGQR